MKTQKNNRDKIASLLTRLLLSYCSLQAAQRKQELSSWAREAALERSGLFSSVFSCRNGELEPVLITESTGTTRLRAHPGHLYSHVQRSLPLAPKLAI